MDRQQFTATFIAHTPHLAEKIAARIAETGLETYAGIPREQLVHMATAAVQSFIRDLAEDQAQHFAGYWETVAEARAEQGARVDDLIQAIFLSEAVLQAQALEAGADTPEARIWWLNRLHQIVYSGVMVLAKVFVAVRERVILAQKAQIRELSTPIIPLYTGVLVLPVVGAIDSYRAGQIMEALLTGITDQQADVVIIDITGVPMVDTSVANYLLQAARAARLLGAHVVLVGIGPEIAQTIVQLGVDLADITTRANLQAGIEYALSLQGMAILPSGQR